MNKAAILLDEEIIEPDLTITFEEFYAPTDSTIKGLYE